MAECKSIMIIMVSHRSKFAVEVQKILTDWGCSIKTRLGIHDGVGSQCSDNGLIILELAASKDEIAKMESKLSALDGISVKVVEMCV